MNGRFVSPLLLGVLLSGCVTAEPAAVARAVGATLTAALTPTPIVVVVTALGGGPAIPTVTPGLGAQQTQAAATETLAAGSATPLPPEATALVEATDTATAPTEAPSATPVPSAAPAASAAPLAHGEVIFEDDFTDPGLWTLTDDSVYKTAVTGGQFVFTIKAADQYGFVFSSKRRASDFVASLSATAAACKFRDRYGLLFRVANLSNYYQFDVDCDGAYRLSKVVDGRLTPLQNWMKNEAVNRGSGAQNELAVRANGKNIEVFVNGVSLRALTDVTFSEGGFGIYAGSGLSETYTAQFEQLNVWKVK